ncbi:tripartite tricarboxylate transporter TctB family protein [Bosea caraganae]|uniref:Tripartite tricarboxylate transporter TctB family protein n=1 Tax=Bosea caraganae TaxID=2763117 RepID=A0A370L367_9HYPH|nr:tripartite tricarboxylate transporter TctB family protein [Bosea caraganae]RDJ22874.1 tripartite tricarboxylate transporter TctB family protein [Bosea caraganae]RDJ28653.1 tripartite tricarboxylate transporter TctB family protein [Bosea caraganae]
MANETITRRIDRPALVVAALLLASAGLVANDASQQTIVSTYGLGPTAVPYVVSICLAILGLTHVVVAFKDGIPTPDKADTGAILSIVAGLVGLVACIALGGGFILATALIFACTARGMGRRAFAVDFAIGLVLGLGIFLVFQKLLTLSLPAGPLEHLFF